MDDIPRRRRRFRRVLAAVAAVASTTSVLAAAAGAPVTAGAPIPVPTPAHPDSVTSSATTQYTSNWAGNVVNGATYTDAEAVWVVPSAGSPSGAAVLHWVGVGLGNSTTYPLLQAGTATDVGSGSYVWIETFPYDALVRVPYFGSVGGHSITVHVTFTTSGGAAIHIHDNTNGRDQHCSPTNTACKVVTRSGMRPDGHAEWITESVGSKLVADFGKVSFTSVQAYSAATGWKGVGSLSHYAVVMVNGKSQAKVAPYYIGSDQKSFANFWYRAS